MFKLPKLKKGKPLNQCNTPIIGGSEGTECVSPKRLMEKAIREAFEEVLEGSQYEIKIDSNILHMKIGGD